MKIEIIEVTEANVMDIINDESVYVIKSDYFHKDKIQMMPIKKADIGDLMSNDGRIVRITK